MLYWNSDSTRLPAKLHSDYLRSMYLHNKIVKKEYKFKDLILDLSKIKTPMFHVATTEDHIAPWKSVFSGLKIITINVNLFWLTLSHCWNYSR